MATGLMMMWWLMKNPPNNYPLAWNNSYEQKGQQWRGHFDLARYEVNLNLTGNVLELGSGDGNTASQILNKASNITCLDVASSSFQTMPIKDMSVGKIVGDARSLPLKDQYYSTIICRHVLTHARQGDENLVLQEISRALAPGGTALFEVFTPNDMRYGKGQEIELDTFLRGDDLIWRFYNEDELKDLIEKAGLKIQKIEVLARTVRHDGVEHQRESLVVVASSVQ